MTDLPTPCVVCGRPLDQHDPTERTACLVYLTSSDCPDCGHPEAAHTFFGCYVPALLECSCKRTQTYENTGDVARLVAKLYMEREKMPS